MARRDNPLPEDEYGENHHIVPKSIDPSLVKDKNNIVRLSASEHFKAHYFLFRHYKEVGDEVYMRKMSFCLHRMKAQIFAHLSEEDLERVSKMYEYARKHTPPMSDEMRRHLSQIRKGRPGHKQTPENIERFKQMARRKKSEEHRRKLSQAKKSKGAWRGENNPKYGRGADVRGEKNGMWGRHRTDEEKAHLAKCHSRPVAVYKDGQLVGKYPSVREVEKVFGLHVVGSMITGKRRNPTPFTFKHITMEEYENG